MQSARANSSLDSGPWAGAAKFRFARAETRGEPVYSREIQQRLARVFPACPVWRVI